MDGIDRNRIRGMMTERRMTYRDLATETGYTITTISNFLNGKNPTYGLMRAIKTALKMDAATADSIFFVPDLPTT